MSSPTSGSRPHEEPRQPVVLSSAWSMAKELLIDLRSRNEDIPDPEVPTPNPVDDIIPSRKCDDESLGECCTCLLGLVQRLDESKRLLDQIDLLRPLVVEMGRLMKDGSSSVDRIVDSVVEGLIDLITSQLYGTKLRKHFVMALLEMKRSAELSQYDDIVIGAISKKQLNMLLSLNTSDNEELIRITKEISVMLEEPEVFISLLIFDNCGSPGLLIVDFFSNLILKESRIRISPSSFSDQFLSDTFLCIVVKTTFTVVSQFLNKFSYVSSKCLTESSKSPVHDEWYLVMPSFLRLTTGALNLLDDSAAPREVVTVCGLLVSSFVCHSLQDRSSILDLLDHFIGISEEKIPIYDDFIKSLFDEIKEHWDNLKLIPKLSLIRGFLVELPVSTPVKAEDGQHLISILNFFHFHSGSENMSERLYVTQAVSVWLSLASDWIKVGILSEEQFSYAVPLMLEISAKNWDNSFPVLKSLSLTLWTDLVQQCGLSFSKQSTPDSEEPSKMYDLIYTRMLSLNGSCAKLQYLALESLMSKLGADWVIERQPFLIDHLLASISSRPTRNAALQFLTSFIRHCLPSKKSVTTPSLQLLINKISLALLGIIHTPDPAELESLKNSVILLLPDSLDDRESLTAELSCFLVPVLGQHFPNILTSILEAVMRDRDDDVWTAAESALILAARVGDRARWVSRDLVSDSPQLELWGSTKSLIRISRDRITAALIHGNPVIRLNAIEMTCTSRQTTIAPSHTEWLLIRRICCDSLKGLTPEERCKTCASIKKFINRVMESFKLRSGMKYESISSLYVSNEITRQQLMAFHRELKQQIDPAVPFDRLATALDIFVFLYQFASTIELPPLSDRNRFFEFLYADDEWNCWISFTNSNWDKQRVAATTILETFPYPKYPDHLIQRALELMHGVRQREFMGGACIIALLASMSIFNPMKSSAKNSYETQSRELCRTLERHLQIESRYPYTDGVIPILKNSCSLSAEMVEQVNRVFIKFVLPLDFVILITDAIHSQLATSSDDTMASWKCHGLLNLLCRSVYQLPPCTRLFLSLSQELESGKIPPSIRIQIKAFFSALLSETIQKVCGVQWASTTHVLGVLMDGVDAVLISTDLTSQVGLPSTEDFKRNGAHFRRVMGVDCRGHPVLEKGTDMEEDVCLLGSWMTVKEGAECLSRIFEWIDLDLILDQSEGPIVRSTDTAINHPEAITPDFFDALGHRLLTVLLGIKHPAAMDKLFGATLALNKRLLLTRRAAYRQLPSLWLTRCEYLASLSILRLFDLVKGEVSSDSQSSLSLPPPLRRSYSLGLAFLSIITADQTKYISTDLFSRSIKFLLELEESDATIDPETPIEDETFSLFVHQLNILRCVVRSAALVMPCAEHIGRILAVSMRFLSHPKWAVRNSANLLFASTLDRATGGNWDLLGEEPGPQSPAVDVDFGDAKSFLFCTNGAQRELQSRKARPLADLLRIHPPLMGLISERLVCRPGVDPVTEGVSVALLLFLSRVRLSSPADQKDLQTQLDHLHDRVLYYLYNSRCYHARVLASRTVVTTALYRNPKFMGDDAPLTKLLFELFTSGLQKSITAKRTLNNNALHGTLASVLEFCSRPNTCSMMMSEYLSTPDPLLPMLLKQMEDVLRLQAAPLCRAVSVQIAERMIISLSHCKVSNSNEVLKREWVSEWSKSFAISQLPLRLQQRLSFASDHHHHSWDQLPGHIPLEVSAIRLLLLSDLTDIPIFMAALLKQTNDDSEDIQSHSAALSEALRISSKIISLLTTGSQTPLYPYFSAQKIITESGDALDILIDVLQNFVTTILNQIECRSPFSSQSSSFVSLKNLVGGAISDTAVVDLGLRGLKLLVALMTLRPFNPSALAMIRRSIATLRNLCPSNPRVLRAAVLLGARLRKLDPVEGEDADWMEAMRIAATSTADVNARYAALRGLQISGVNEFRLWQRAIVLVMDETPEIQAGAAEAIYQALRLIMLSNKSIQFSDDLKKKFINEIKTCDEILPNIALFWATHVVVSIFPASEVGEWLLSILAGRSTDFNIAADLSSLAVEWLDQTESLSSGRAAVFDLEPSNIFNEDGYFLQLLGKLYFELPNRDLHRFILNEEIEELSYQLEICSSICEIGNTSSIGHITRSPSTAGTLQALLIRTALTLQALPVNQPIPMSLKIAIEKLSISSMGKGVHPSFSNAVNTISSAVHLVESGTKFDSMFSSIWFNVVRCPND